MLASILLFFALLSLFMGILDVITKAFTTIVADKSSDLEAIYWICSALFFALFYYYR